MPSDTTPQPTRRERLVLPLIVLVVVAGVVLSSILTKAPTAAIENLTDATVVAQLGAFRKPYPEDLRKAARRARDNPADSAAAVAAARAYIAYGRSVGDARLVGTALGFLSPLLKQQSPNPEVLVLAATALQYNHDFAGALKLLDEALARAPDYADARLIRADLDVVQGRLGEAQADCRKLPGTGRIDLALICDATARALTAGAAKAYERLSQLAAVRGAMTPELKAYADGLLGEIALVQGWRDKGRAGLEAALAAEPDDLRTRMVYADFLLAERDPSAALAAMADAPPTDGIVLRRAIAWRDLGDTGQMEAASQTLEQTFSLQRQLGLSVHAREEARFRLEIAKDPQAALERATANWATQRELEDAQLLLDAADAAGAPQAALAVMTWMRDEGVVAPALRIPDSIEQATP